MTTIAKIDANRANALKSTGPRTEAGITVAALNAVRHGVFAAVPVIPGEDAAEWDAHRAGVVASLTPVGLLELTLAERAAGLLWRLRRLAVYEAEAVRAAVEDVRLPRPMAETPGRVERAVQDAKKQVAASRRYLADARPAVEWLDGLSTRAEDEPVPVVVARRVFQAAIEVLDKYDHDTQPPAGDSARFLRRLGREEGEFAAVPWTVALIRAGIEMYAKFIGKFIERPAVWLTDEIASDLSRRNRYHERNEKVQTARGTGLRRRQRRSADWRCAGAALLSDGRDERVIRYEGHLSKNLHTTLHELERMQSVRAGRPVRSPVAIDVSVEGMPEGGGFVS